MLFISIVVAYLLTGFSYAMKDLSGPVLSRPVWSLSPTFGMLAVYIFLWPISQVYRRHPRSKREVFFSLLLSVLQMALITGFVWCCFSFSVYVFDNTVIEIIGSVVFLLIGIRFVLPFVNLAAIPVLMLILLPLKLLFSAFEVKGKPNKEGE